MDNKIKSFTLYFGKGSVPDNSPDLSASIQNDLTNGRWIDDDQFNALTTFLEKEKFPEGRYEITYIPKGVY